MSKIANYVQADNGLGLAICEEIDEEWLSDYEYKQRFGVSRDGTVNFLFTDQGPDRIWGAMTREQQIAVLEWCELSELIEELVKPETAQEASVRQAMEANPKSIMTDSSLSAFKIELSYGVEGLPQRINGRHSAVFPDSGSIGISGITDHGLRVDDIVHVAIVKEGNTPSKLGGAAAGAALGFLLAGPLGTAIGGLAGSNRQSQDTLGGITFKCGATLLVTVDASNMAGFLSLQARYPFTSTTLVDEKKSTIEVDPSNLTKECPRCAETIKLKAMVCRFCGHEFSQSEVTEALQKASENVALMEFERLEAESKKEEEEELLRALPKDVYIQRAPDPGFALSAIDALIDGLEGKHPGVRSYREKTRAIRDLCQGNIKVAERVSADIAQEIIVATEGLATILVEDVMGEVAGQKYDVKFLIKSRNCKAEAIQILSELGIASSERASIVKSATPGFLGVSLPVSVEEGVDLERVEEWKAAVKDRQFFSVDAEPAKPKKGSLLLNAFLELS